MRDFGLFCAIFLLAMTAFYYADMKQEIGRRAGYAAAVDSVRAACVTHRDTTLALPYVAIRTITPQSIRVDYVRLGESRMDTIFSEVSR